ncbi:MAG: accessory gene regulator ArgB-like protein [Bacillota bacterium]
MDKLINRILSVYKKELQIDKDQEAITQYALRILISTIVGYVVTLLIAWPLGVFTYALILLLITSVLRSFSGGAHCSSARNCTIYGTLIVSILALLLKHIPFSTPIIMSTIPVTFFFSLWAINKYAPADTPGKPIGTKKQKEVLRKWSLILLCIWGAVVIVSYYMSGAIHPWLFVSAVGLLWQSFSLTKTGYMFCHFADKILNKVFRERRNLCA